MEYKYLPPNKDNKLYSPIGVQSLFNSAVLDEGGNVQAIFDKKDKHKKLLELWYASALAAAIHKWTGDKFYMYPSENPDVHFIRVNELGKQEGFSAEIMTLYNYGQKTFDQDYLQLVKNIWKSKGNTDYDRSDLLLVSRLTGLFDVDKFAAEISKLQWPFLRIWLSVFNQTNKNWTIFELLPRPDQSPVGKIIVSLSELPY